ncbi:MAG: DUF4296 domain-containing protein [Lutibacter sp.]
MKIKTYLILSLTLLISCHSNTILKKPKDLIPKDTMVNIITDMILANSAYRIKNINLHRNVNYFPLIYKKYNIDSARFKASNFYYTSTIDEYDHLLNQVKQNLTHLKKEADSTRKVEDSIRRIKNKTAKLKKSQAIKLKQKRELDSIKKLKLIPKK